VKTYLFKVVVERDDEGWLAYAPSLKSQGASAWGETSEQALESLQQVLKMTLASMREHGEPIPASLN